MMLMARLARIAGLALAAALVAAAPGHAQTRVDLELVLAVDSSGSVDFDEYDLQARGIADAFRDPEVIAAIEGAAPNGLAIAVFQWSGRDQHTLAVDWIEVHDGPSAAVVADRIDKMSRSLVGETAIAEALGYALRLLERNRFAGARQVIDVSGDGPNNAGARPDEIRDAAVLAGITINGLAIRNELPTLDLYYADHVIGGPGAFVLTARDFDDFAQAIRRKLIREIRGAALAALPRD